MDTGARIKQPTDDRFVFLKQKQDLSKEGSPEWYSWQQQLNQIIAERFLQYLNR